MVNAKQGKKMVVIDGLNLALKRHKPRKVFDETSLFSIAEHYIKNRHQVFIMLPRVFLSGSLEEIREKM